MAIATAEETRIVAGSEEKLLASLPTRPLAQRTLSVCGVWPRGSAPADFATPLTSDVPALLFSGGMDPVLNVYNFESTCTASTAVCLAGSDSTFSNGSESVAITNPNAVPVTVYVGVSSSSSPS